MREVCFIIGRGGAVLWSDGSESPLALPDSRARWEAIWRLRAELECIVHSHPVGPHAFSAEDRSTMEAVEAALGRKVCWMVLSPQGLVVENGETPAEQPWWTRLLRLASGM